MNNNSNYAACCAIIFLNSIIYNLSIADIKNEGNNLID